MLDQPRRGTLAQPSGMQAQLLGMGVKPIGTLDPPRRGTRAEPHGMIEQSHRGTLGLPHRGTLAQLLGMGIKPVGTLDPPHRGTCPPNLTAQNRISVQHISLTQLETTK